MSVQIKKDITTVQVEVPKTNVAIENAVTQISVQTSTPQITISSVGINGKDGITPDISKFALLSGSNNFIGNQFISGGIQVNNITFVDGNNATIEKIPISSEIYFGTYTLVNIEGYSTGSTDTLPSSSYNTPTDIPAPWTAFYLDAGNGTAVSSIEVGDILAGTAIIPSTVQHREGNIVIINLDLSLYDEIILPQTGSRFELVRPITKQALEIKAEGDTDIFLNPMGSGSVITNKSIIPAASNQLELGLPTRRWKELWIGSGSIYIQDETLGIDHKLTARDGDFVIDGSAGLVVGQFTFHDNKILLKDSDREIVIGETLASGSVTFNRPIRVNASNGEPTFNVRRDGRVQIISPNIPAGDIGALSIIGNPSGSYQPITAEGSMVHITGNDGKLNRFNMDSFGTGSFNSIVFRTGRGTAASPLQLKANDTILRLAGAGWKSDTGFGGPSSGFSAVSIDFVSLNDQTSTTAGTQQQFYNSPLNQNVRTLSAAIDTDGLILPNIPTNETADKILVWDATTGRVGKQSGVSTIDGGAAASVFIMTTEVLNGGNA